MRRNTATLETLQALGADETINLTDQTHLDQRLRDVFAGGVDVVLDYLWGPSAEALLTAATARTTDRPVRFIQIGTTSAPTITLPGRPLHSAAIEIKGSGVGSVHPTAIAQILRDLITAAPATKFQVATRPVPPRAGGSSLVNRNGNSPYRPDHRRSLNHAGPPCPFRNISRDRI